MQSLKTKLLEKYSEGTANLYLTKLRILNKDKPFTTVGFLKDHVKISELISKIDNANTRKSYLTAVVGVLDIINNATYNKINSHYKLTLNTFKKDILSKIDPNVKTATQEANWITWTEVLDVQKRLALEAEKVTAESITNNVAHSIDAIERNVLLSLYTMLPPRRNADYFHMIIGSGTEEDKNYYTGDKFIFNIYKTARSRGAERIDVPNSLQKVLDHYIKLMNLKDGDYLLYPEITNRDTSVKMTRALNSIFGKAVSSSMLRHIWNTHLLGDVLSKIKNNADSLGHAIGTDLAYVKI